MCALNDVKLLNSNALSAVKTIWCASPNVLPTDLLVQTVSFQVHFASSHYVFSFQIVHVKSTVGMDAMIVPIRFANARWEFHSLINLTYGHFDLTFSRTWNQTQIGTCVLIIMEWQWGDVSMLVMEMKPVNLIAWLLSKPDKWTVLVK